MRKIFIAMWFLILFSVPVFSYAKDVTLAWDHSTSPGVSYIVWYGPTERTGMSPTDNPYPHHIKVGYVDTYTIQDLGPGTWYFSVSAYIEGVGESSYSNEVSTTLPGYVPPADNLHTPVQDILAPNTLTISSI